MGQGAYGLTLKGPLRLHPAMRLVPAAVGQLDLIDAGGRQRLEVEELAARGEEFVLTMAEGTDLRVVQTGPNEFRAVLHGGPARTMDDLVHPYLAPVAALIHRWFRTPALHGAALTKGNGAVALIAAREMGKTTTAAAMVELRGASLLADDLVVIKGGHVLPGPLSLDLRAPALHLLGLDGTSVRGGDRHRRLAPEKRPDARSEALKAIVHLRFGRVAELRPLAVRDRLALLAEQLYWPGLGGGPEDLLSLAAVPHVLLTRPRGEEGMRFALDRLVDLLE